MSRKRKGASASTATSAREAREAPLESSDIDDIGPDISGLTALDALDVEIARLKARLDPKVVAVLELAIELLAEERKKNHAPSEVGPQDP